MPFAIPLAYSALGAFSMIVQAILLREFFVVAAGNEISFGIAMGGWLLGAGKGTGAVLSRRRRSTAGAFSWAVLAMCLVAPLLLAAARSLHRLAGVPQGALLPLAKTLYLVPLLFLPFSALSGFAFPLAAKLRPLQPNKAEPAMAGAYAWESLGAMAGGLAYTFWLVGRFDPATIIAMSALPLVLGSQIACRGAKGAANSAAGVLAVVLLVGALLGGWTGRCESWLVDQRWQGISSARLVAARDTKYQNLQLGLSGGQYSLFANGQLAAVFPDDAGDECSPHSSSASIRARATSWSSATSSPAWPSTCCATRSPRSPRWRSTTVTRTWCAATWTQPAAPSCATPVCMPRRWTGGASSC
jgi:predicted membrane-bound spermidine synthase